VKSFISKRLAKHSTGCLSCRNRKIKHQYVTRADTRQCRVLVDELVFTHGQLWAYVTYVTGYVAVWTATPPPLNSDMYIDTVSTVMGTHVTCMDFVPLIAFWTCDFLPNEILDKVKPSCPARSSPTDTIMFQFVMPSVQSEVLHQ